MLSHGNTPALFFPLKISKPQFDDDSNIFNLIIQNLFNLFLHDPVCDKLFFSEDLRGFWLGLLYCNMTGTFSYTGVDLPRGTASQFSLVWTVRHFQFLPVQWTWDGVQHGRIHGHVFYSHGHHRFLLRVHCLRSLQECR